MTDVPRTNMVETAKLARGPSRTIRREELRRRVPLGDTTIYEMEQKGEFPHRFNLTPRCVVWDLDEVEAWLLQRRQASRDRSFVRATPPDVRQRKLRPVRRQTPGR